jgi:hypothetical protein
MQRQGTSFLDMAGVVLRTINEQDDARRRGEHMTVDELRELCNKPSLLAPHGDRVVILVMPGKWGNKDTRLLSGRGSPVGRIMSDYFGPGRGIVVQFKATEVLPWINEMEGRL